MNDPDRVDLNGKAINMTFEKVTASSQEELAEIMKATAAHAAVKVWNAATTNSDPGPQRVALGDISIPIHIENGDGGIHLTVPDLFG